MHFAAVLIVGCGLHLLKFVC